jgi:type IV pilus assembly protein PilO
MRKFFDDLRALDANDVGRWPLLFRGLAIGLIFVIVTAAATYYTVIKQKVPVLEAAQQEEQKLRGAFELKQRKAANFEAYKSQLAEIEQSFGAMLQGSRKNCSGPRVSKSGNSMRSCRFRSA